MWEVHDFLMGRFIYLDVEIIFSYCSNADFSSFETKKSEVLKVKIEKFYPLSKL